MKNYKNKIGQLKDALFGLDLPYESITAIVELAEEAAREAVTDIEHNITLAINRSFVDAKFPVERIFTHKYKAGGIHVYTWVNAPDGITEITWSGKERRSKISLNRWAETLELILKQKS